MQRAEFYLNNKMGVYYIPVPRRQCPTRVIYIEFNF